MPMRTNRFFRWALAGLWIGIIFLAGCGKKGDPIPPKAVVPTAITELSGVSKAGRMLPFY